MPAVEARWHRHLSGLIQQVARIGVARETERAECGGHAALDLVSVKG